MQKITPQTTLPSPALSQEGEPASCWAGFCALFESHTNHREDLALQKLAQYTPALNQFRICFGSQESSPLVPHLVKCLYEELKSFYYEEGSSHAWDQLSPEVQRNVQKRILHTALLNSCKNFPEYARQQALEIIDTPAYQNCQDMCYQFISYMFYSAQKPTWPFRSSSILNTTLVRQLETIRIHLDPPYRRRDWIAFLSSRKEQGTRWSRYWCYAEWARVKKTPQAEAIFTATQQNIPQNIQIAILTDSSTQTTVVPSASEKIKELWTQCGDALSATAQMVSRMLSLLTRSLSDVDPHLAPFTAAGTPYTIVAEAKENATLVTDPLSAQQTLAQRYWQQPLHDAAFYTDFSPAHQTFLEYILQALQGKANKGAALQFVSPSDNIQGKRNSETDALDSDKVYCVVPLGLTNMVSLKMYIEPLQWSQIEEGYLLSTKIHTPHAIVPFSEKVTYTHKIMCRLIIKTDDPLSYIPHLILQYDNQTPVFFIPFIQKECAKIAKKKCFAICKLFNKLRVKNRKEQVLASFDFADEEHKHVFWQNLPLTIAPAWAAAPAP